MRDGEMVSGIVAGNPTALAEAYDHYAPALYAYCRSLLAEPAAAADALYDTFIVAAAKLYGLRDPSRLRPWLYAVARNECHRALRGRPGTGLFDELPAGSEDTHDFGSALDQAELRELVWFDAGRAEPGGPGDHRADPAARVLRRGPRGCARRAAESGARAGHPGPDAVRDGTDRAAGGPLGARLVPGTGGDPGRLGRRADRAPAQAGAPASQFLPGLRRAPAAGRQPGRRAGRAAHAQPPPGYPASAAEPGDRSSGGGHCGLC